MDLDALKRMYRTAVEEHYPHTLTVEWEGVKRSLVKSRIRLRYGVNPHQRAALYVSEGSFWEGVKEVKTGKSGLSQTNMEDVDRALRILNLFEEPSCAVMKHLIPSGLASSREGDRLRDVYLRARDCDSQAAWGGVVVFNRPVDGGTAREVGDGFVEVVAAPSYGEEALRLFREKKSLRVLSYPLQRLLGVPRRVDRIAVPLDFEARTLLDGSLLISDPSSTRIRTGGDLFIVTEKKPTEGQVQDMIFSWRVIFGVRSNGVVISKDRATLAIGAGQQDRVTAVRLSVEKACERGHREELRGAVLASDGFFPFRDSIDVIADYGIEAVIQPGGSIRDREVIDACEEHGIAMAFTGERAFSHF